jgi:hypothetical protein
MLKTASRRLRAPCRWDALSTTVRVTQCVNNSYTISAYSRLKFVTQCVSYDYAQNGLEAVARSMPMVRDSQPASPYIHNYINICSGGVVS